MSAALTLVADDAATTAPDLLTSLIKDFEDAEFNGVDEREQAERCRDYVCGKQWTEEEAKELRLRGQPLVWNNIVAEKVEILRGIERRGRSDPKAFPRTPVEDTRADAATEALRYIADQNRFDVVRSLVYDNMLVEGVGGAEVIVEPVQSADSLMASTALTPPQTDYDVVINHIPWERLFWDRHSQHPGFSDARHIGMVIWMDRDEALERWPDCGSVLETTFSGYSWDTFDDKPRMMWCDNRRRRVRVVQMWFKRGRDWWSAIFTKGGCLEEPLVSLYLDRHGDGHCPIILRSAHIDRDNNRFGVVKDMIPRQDMVNKRESKLLWSLAVNQIIMEEGAVDDEDQTRLQAARPDGVIKRNKGFELEIRKDTAEIEGQFKMLQFAIQQMQLSGPNAAMSGKDPRELSGRAILAQQSGGMLQNEALVDELRQWDHKVWEACWMRVRQFWTNERWIRVTDSDRNIRFVGLNRRVTLADLLGQLDQSKPLPEQLQGLPQDEQQAVMLGLRLPPGHPLLQRVVKIENDIGDMDVDITVEEGPDVPTVKHESFQAMMTLPPELLLEIGAKAIVKMNPGLRGEDKTEILGILDERHAEQAKGQQQAQAMAIAQQQADVQEKQAAAADRQASAVQKLHGIAHEHAQAQVTPVVPGVGPVPADINPLLQPSPMQPQQAAG